MAKYVLKESELNAILGKIIAEEVASLNEGRFSRWLGNKAKGAARGAWNLTKDTAKFAGKSVISPFTAAGDAFAKAGKVLTGQEPIGGNGSIKTSAGGAAVAKKRGDKGIDYNNINSTRKEFGIPETVGGMGLRLTSKRDITVPNFLGLGKDVRFGEHYYEQYQSGDSSVFNSKIKKAEKEIAGEKDDNKKLKMAQDFYDKFNAWLYDRDDAYENYVKISNEVKK